MPLAAGHRLGPYEIVSPIGAGGMGEVYRARDTRLQREVAIKIVPAAVADNAVALARFEREAQAVAALSHPNILAIHDFGREEGVSYAVMQLLEGRSLSDVLASGPLPTRKAVDYAKQIADGLAAAHDKAIVHRDLKPANIFVNDDGRVTILDFGLARAAAAAPNEASDTVAPDTMPGMVVGTMGYMSPEQVRAQVVDHRSDIFAFGAVLYELASGRRAFAGTTPADTMSAILTAEPGDLASAAVSPSLDRIIRRCLEKEPGRRFQSTRDLGFAIDSLSSASGSGAPSAVAPGATTSRSRLPLIAAACLVAGAIAGGFAMRTRPAPPETPLQLVRFQIPSRYGVPPWTAASDTALAWGASVAGGNAPSLFYRNLTTMDVTLVKGTEGTEAAVFDPTGRRLVIVNTGQFFEFDQANGNRTLLLDTRKDTRVTNLRGMALAADGRLIWGGGEAIFLMPNAADPQAPAQEIARPDKTMHDWYGFPQWLPDERMLYLAHKPNAQFDILVRAIGGGPETRLDVPSDITRVIVDPRGVLIYARSSALVAQRIDFSTLKLIDSPVTIGSDPSMNRVGAWSASVSANVLAFRPITLATKQFEWVNRAGLTLSKLGPVESFTNFDLSPDGTQVAVLRDTPDDPLNSIWVIDGVRGVASQTVDSSSGRDTMSDPTWSADGQRLAYRRGNTVVVRNAFGGSETTLKNWRGYPDSWSRDGRYLAVGRPSDLTFDLYAIRSDGSPEEIRLTTGVQADEPRFSPDGKWVAFHVTTDNVPNVFVMPFPPTGEKFQVSSGSGAQPRWNDDGSELFFLGPDAQMMSVEMPDRNPRKAKAAQPLFRTGLEVSPINDQFSTRDGKRFLIMRPVAEVNQSPVNVILNWYQLLKP